MFHDAVRLPRSLRGGRVASVPLLRRSKRSLGRRWTCGAALTFAAMAVAHPYDAAAETLRFADSLPADHLFTRVAARPWMDAVTAATNGAVKFEHYPAEQLGKAKDMLSVVRNGVADVGFVVPGFMTDKMPLSSVVDLPGGFTTSCGGVRAYWPLARDGIVAKQEMAPNGFKALFAIVQPPYAIYTSKKRIESSKDVSGLRLRTVGGMMNLLVREMGGAPVQLSGPELREAISRGTIDGGIFADVSVASYDLTPLIKYRTTGEFFGSAALLYGMSETRFARLPAGVQAAMVKAGEEITMQACKRIDENTTEAIDKMVKGGITLVEIPANERQALGAVFTKVAAEWAQDLDKRGKPGTAVVEAFRQAVAKP